MVNWKMSLMVIGLRMKRRNSLNCLSKWKIVTTVVILALILLAVPALSEMTYDFKGTVERVSEPNGLFININNPNATGSEKSVDVLIDHPIDDLPYFVGKELDFIVLGHDILGRPVCDAYLNGVDIQWVYYCRMHPLECEYYRDDLDNGYWIDNNYWIDSRYVPCSPVCSSYGFCRGCS